MPCIIFSLSLELLKSLKDRLRVVSWWPNCMKKSDAWQIFYLKYKQLSKETESLKGRLKIQYSVLYRYLLPLVLRIHFIIQKHLHSLTINKSKYITKPNQILLLIILKCCYRQFRLQYLIVNYVWAQTTALPIQI